MEKAYRAKEKRQVTKKIPEYKEGGYRNRGRPLYRCIDQ